MNFGTRGREPPINPLGLNRILKCATWPVGETCNGRGSDAWMEDDMTDRDDESSLDELNEEADIAADYLEGLLDALDFDGDIEMGVRDGRPIV